MDAFAALAEPNRRRILGALRGGARSVGDLVAALELPQPMVSKHLRVLREAAFVTCRGAAQRRIYGLDPRSFAALDAWLAPYRALWTHHLDALERHLDRRSSSDDEP